MADFLRKSSLRMPLAVASGNVLECDADIPVCSSVPKVGMPPAADENVCITHFGACHGSIFGKNRPLTTRVWNARRLVSEEGDGHYDVHENNHLL